MKDGYAMVLASVVSVIAMLRSATAAPPEACALTVEQEIVQDLSFWEERGKAPVSTGGYLDTLCRKVNRLPENDGKRFYFHQIEDRLLAVNFECQSNFPFEVWGTEPFVLKSNDPRTRLVGMHRSFVSDMATLYHGLRASDLPLEEQFAPCFRFALKVDAEKYRLKTLDIGDASVLLDEMERDLYALTSLTNGSVAMEQKMRLLNSFERTFYRPIRSPDEIEEDRRLLDAAKATAHRRMLKTFKVYPTGIRHFEMKREWLEKTGKDR